MHEFQQRIGNWQKEAYSEDLLTPEIRLARASLEWDELMEEASNGADIDLMAHEAVDVIIGLIGFIETTGYDAQELVNEKIEVMYAKYDLELLESLRMSGYSHTEAIDEAKKRWTG